MSQVLDMLLSGLGVAGNVLDTPGALVRNTLSGRNPFSGLNPFDSEGRASGRDMLESWGALDANEDGLDWGDVAGFGAELVTDPLNFMGLGAARKTATAAREARAANAASDAAKWSNLNTDRLFSAASDASRAAEDARVFSSTGMVAGKPDTVVDLLRVDPEVSRSLDAAATPLRGRVLSDPEKLRFLHGSQDDAADMVSQLTGYKLSDPHPAVSAMYEKSGVRPYGIDVDEFIGRFDENDPMRWALPDKIHNGFVMSDRPDMAFVRSTGTLPKQIGTGAHEAVHSLARLYPEDYARMASAAGGDDAVMNAISKLPPDEQMGWLMQSLAGVPASSQIEEAIALEAGNATVRGTPKQRFPVVDNAFVSGSPYGSPDPGVVEDMASLMSEGVFKDPRAVSEELLAFLGGQTRQRHSLIPTGRSSQFNPYRSFADVPQTPDVSGLKYLDIGGPAANPGSVNPLLAMLLGHNTLARGSQF